MHDAIYEPTMISDLAWTASNKSQWYDPTRDEGSRNARGMTVGILRDAVSYEHLLLCMSVNTSKTHAGGLSSLVTSESEQWLNRRLR